MEMQLVSKSTCLNSGVSRRNNFFEFLHAASLLWLTSVHFTFVYAGPGVMASCVFSGMEDSYTVTCGMPLPCLADAQRNSSGLSCLGEYLPSLIRVCLYALPHKASSAATTHFQPIRK